MGKYLWEKWMGKNISRTKPADKSLLMQFPTLYTETTTILTSKQWHTSVLSAHIEPKPIQSDKRWTNAHGNQ